MQADPMYSIDLQQLPERPAPLCRAPRIDFETNGTTHTRITHCPFIDDTRNYYYPVVDSRVLDVNYNCFYPGKGPGGDEEIGAHRSESSTCQADGTNCCSVTSTPSQAFCCNGKVVEGIADQAGCLTYAKNLSK